MEKSKAGAKERSPDNLSLPNQNAIVINLKWYYFTRHGKNTVKFYLQNKMELNNRKMTNHPPCPVTTVR